MTDTEAKALALVNEACKSDFKDLGATYRNNILDALLLAIERLEATEARHAAELREQAERFEAFRQEVSDVLEDVRDNTTYDVHPKLWRFITPKPKPDPLVEAIRAMALSDATQDDADRLRAALQARGGKIVWGEGQ